MRSSIISILALVATLFKYTLATDTTPKTTVTRRVMITETQQFKTVTESVTETTTTVSTLTKPTTTTTSTVATLTKPTTETVSTVLTVTESTTETVTTVSKSTVFKFLTSTVEHDSTLTTSVNHVSTLTTSVKLRPTHVKSNPSSPPESEMPSSSSPPETDMKISAEATELKLDGIHWNPACFGCGNSTEKSGFSQAIEFFCKGGDDRLFGGRSGALKDGKLLPGESLGLALWPIKRQIKGAAVTQGNVIRVLVTTIGNYWVDIRNMTAQTCVEALNRTVNGCDTSTDW